MDQKEQLREIFADDIKVFYIKILKTNKILKSKHLYFM